MLSVVHYSLPPLCQNGEEGEDESERDVYEYMLTREEIQAGLDGVNTAVAREIAEAKCKLHVYVVWLLSQLHVHVRRYCVQGDRKRERERERERGGVTIKGLRVREREAPLRA